MIAIQAFPDNDGCKTHAKLESGTLVCTWLDPSAETTSNKDSWLYKKQHVSENQQSYYLLYYHQLKTNKQTYLVLSMFPALWLFPMAPVCQMLSKASK